MNRRRRTWWPSCGCCRPLAEAEADYSGEESFMKGFVKDIEGLAVKNDEFRRVLYTAKNCQLVVMALKPKEEIGAEVHKLDQFFRVEEGTGEVVLNGVRTPIRAGFAVLVPAGANHNIINTGSAPLKLYTLYAPPNHRDGVVHHTLSLIHISEPTRRTPISYAVFCLKKKKTKQT